MKNYCRLRITRQDFDRLYHHLFPGDADEHGAILLAGISQSDSTPVLLVREVHLAEEGVDYVKGKIGHRALTPQFIHRQITRARDQRLVYLAVHNHGSDHEVGFSDVDFESHELGYPALLQIARGMPVGALVFGKRSLEVDLWMPDGHRLRLNEASIIGTTIARLTPYPRGENRAAAETYDRQIRMFGQAGQEQLKKAQVAIIGLGGVGSIISEILARLGIGHFFLIDADKVETSNLSRIVGATEVDAANNTPKVLVARRVILQSNEHAQVVTIEDDVAKTSVAQLLKECDYLFLAADSMRARLVVNALVHQYFIPGVQLGAKIRASDDGQLIDVMSANRPLRPGQGCLWCNQLIDPTQLAKEAKSDDERNDQAYGVEEANPSVITLNAVAASHAANDFLLDYLCLRLERKELHYEHFHFLKDARTLVQPRRDGECPECSERGMRYGKGDGTDLPCMTG